MAGRLPLNQNIEIDYTNSELRDIYLAGGCFWGVDAYMRRVIGVASTTVGYANGSTLNPSYKQVCEGDTGHAETVHLRYDPNMISLNNLLVEFFKVIDPTSLDKQGGDYGRQYRTGIYYVDIVDEQVIRSFISNIQSLYDKPIVTEVLPLYCYYLAEEYHQSYLEKNPEGYCHIHF